MSAAIRHRRAVAGPEPGEIVPLRERASSIELTRAGLVAVVLIAAVVMPLPAASRTWLIAGSVGYLLLTATPHAFARLGREPLLGFLQATLLLDGIYLAGVLLETGGTESPLRVLLYVHAVAVTLLLSYRTGLKVTVWHTLLYLLLFEGIVAGVLTPVPHAVADGVRVGTASGIVIAFRIGGLWLLAFAAAAFSALNERELRRQKFDLQDLTAWVNEADQLGEPGLVARSMLDRLHDTFGFARGAVLASATGELAVLATRGAAAAAPVETGLDGVAERAWASRDVVAVRHLDPMADRRLASLLPDAENVLVVPLFAERGARMGVVALEHPDGHTVRRWVVDLVKQFTTHASISLQNAWLLDTIQGQLAEIGDLKDQLLSQNLSLEVRVAEQTEELRGVVAELRETDQQRRALLSHIVTAQEEERERIAGDVHDDPVQKVVALNMRLQLLRRELTDPGHVDTVDRLLEWVESCVVSLRHLLFELRPPILDEQGLGAALREYLQEKDPEFAYRIEDTLDAQPPPETRIVLYRIAQEALMNAYKHSRASEVRVTVEGSDGGYLVQVQDDGVGFGVDGVPRSSERGHLGLTSMRERAELQGGWCELSSVPGGGATVRFWLPDPSSRFAETPDDGLLEAVSSLGDG